MFKRHTISFKHAWDGLVYSLATQPNYRIHLFLSALAITGGFFFRISYSEFIIVILMITIGLVVETLNTGLEQTTDAIDRKIREDIKIAKDVAAAAMLVYSIGAFVVACMIFVPKILAFFH